MNDLRLDYLVEKGYDILLAYGMMPECIATDKNCQACVSKNKTRYKGKLINTSVPTDFKLREEGNIKPIAQYTVSDKIELKLTANSVYMIIIN